jgi:N-acetylglucosamine kinase-like BadF-type ATPase
MTCFLGVDGGGTKTKAVLIDTQGKEVARAAGGPSNYHAVGAEATEASLQVAIRGVLEAAQLKAADVAALGLGIAGGARPQDQEVIRGMLSRIARFPCVLITHDAETALVGAIGRRYGVALIAGTGAIAYGVNARGESRRADGWGYLLGDEGSAYWIGREALRAAARAHDERGPATDLAERLLSHLGLADASRLIRLVYAEGFGVPQVAALAPLVEHAALDGDFVAQAILRQAGWHLGSTLRAVILGLRMGEQTLDVALMGGVLRVQGMVRATVVSSLGEVAPRARAIEPRHDAAWGAALLARQAAQ